MCGGRLGSTLQPPSLEIWVWVKIKPPGDRRFWSMFPSIFDPLPFGFAGLGKWSPSVHGTWGLMATPLTTRMVFWNSWIRIPGFALDWWGSTDGPECKWLWLSKPMGSHFGVGAPFRTYFSGDWDVHWGYGLLTSFDQWPNMTLLGEGN